MHSVAWLTAAAAAAILAGAVASTALASPAAFDGACTFSGPISPGRPITLVPVPGSHFSYVGSGNCSGRLDGQPVSAAAVTVTFKDVQTLFDTCELGPDLGLGGAMVIGGDRFAITVDLGRLALVGPFTLTAGGGRAAGLAQFMPGDAATAPQQCVTPGLAKASLTANFATVSPLGGSRDLTAGSAPARAGGCIDRRGFVFQLHARPGERIVRVDVYVDGRHRLRRAGRNLRSVQLPALARRRHRVTVVTRSDRGATRTSVRRYDRCGQLPPRTVRTG